MTRSALTPQRLTASLGESGAVVHLAEIQAGVAHLERNDNHPWARPARATGGLFWRGSAPDYPGPPSTADAVASYLAIEPGVRPSTEGIDSGSGAGQGFGAGHGRLGGSHRTAAKPRTYDYQAFLNHALGAVWKTCVGRLNSGLVTIESTRDEIVAVTTELNSWHGAAVERCLADGVWNVLLPAEFNDPWAKWTVRL